MRKYIDCELNIREINKGFRPLWEFTYRIVSGEAKERVRVVNKDPDNLLVQWVPGVKTITEIFKEITRAGISIVYLDSLTSVLQELAHWSCHMLIA